MQYGIDPEKYWIFTERRTKGCFSCTHSKRGKRGDRVRSWCALEGVINSDYPDESEDSCEHYSRRHKKPLNAHNGKKNPRHR